MTSNLVLQAEHPEEVMAVLCHEFAHIKEAHLVEAKERQIAHHAIGDLLAIVGTAAEIGARMYGLPIGFNGLGRTLKKAHLQNGYEERRPEDEFEADAYAVKLYASMGLDLELVDDFIVRMGELYGDGSRQTHPAPSPHK